MATLLNDLPALWDHPGVDDKQKQQLVHEILEEARIMGRDLVVIKPKPEYAPHFAYLTLWEKGCLWSGRVDSNHHFLIPAIVRDHS